MIIGKLYGFDVEVFSQKISTWFSRRGHRGCIFSNHSAYCRLEKINNSYGSIFSESTHFFTLPSRRIIIRGLKLAGVFGFPGVQAVYLKSLHKHNCVITVIIDEHNSELWEEKIKERIQRFFSSIATVKQPEPNIPNW